MLTVFQQISCIVCTYDVYSLVEIKFNQMSITPLNTIIIIVTTIITMEQHPLQNNSSKNAKCILPPFKIRSVVAAALCPLKSHQLCMSAQQSGGTILSSTHKNVFLSFIWLRISILWRLSLFSSSYTWFDSSCSDFDSGIPRIPRKQLTMREFLLFLYGRGWTTTVNSVEIEFNSAESIRFWVKHKDERDSIKYSM